MVWRTHTSAGTRIRSQNIAHTALWLRQRPRRHGLPPILAGGAGGDLIISGLHVAALQPSPPLARFSWPHSLFSPPSLFSLFSARRCNPQAATYSRSTPLNGLRRLEGGAFKVAAVWRRRQCGRRGGGLQPADAGGGQRAHRLLEGGRDLQARQVADHAALRVPLAARLLPGGPLQGQPGRVQGRAQVWRRPVPDLLRRLRRPRRRRRLVLVLCARQHRGAAEKGAGEVPGRLREGVQGGLRPGQPQDARAGV